MKEIYISSLAFLGRSPEEIIQTAIENQWSVEFSSGMYYQQDMEQLYINAPIKRMPHNYFPAPKVPFVLNLASNSEPIRNKSIEHCKKGLWLAKQSSSPFFSAHAGFCIDPNPNELGKKIHFSPEFNKDVHRSLFIQSISEVLKTAEELGVDFLIENNVIATFNLGNGSENPLLCCEREEIKWLFDAIPNKKLGLLLDTAHLKVSCKTLGLDLNNEVQELKRYIKIIHHSDNDGLVDNNMPLKETYWFLPWMEYFKEVIHVVEVKNIERDKIQEQIKLLEAHGG